MPPNQCIRCWRQPGSVTAARGSCGQRVVTARDDEAEIIRVLNAGADDYVVKPPASPRRAAARRQALAWRLAARTGGADGSAG